MNKNTVDRIVKAFINRGYGAVPSYNDDGTVKNIVVANKDGDSYNIESLSVKNIIEAIKELAHPWNAGFTAEADKTIIIRSILDSYFEEENKEVAISR